MILFNFSDTVSFAAVITFPMTSFTFPNTSETTSAIFPNASFMVDHNLLTAFRNVSEFLYSATNPATNPATARTTIAIGLADIAAFNSHCPAAAALVATVQATVFAVEAAVTAAFFIFDAIPIFVAVVAAVSAAASAAVAVVFAAIFAITPATISLKFLYAFIVLDTPDTTFPSTTANGPTAATNNPTFMIVLCCPSSRFVNHDVNSLILSVSP